MYRKDSKESISRFFIALVYHKDILELFYFVSNKRNMNNDIIKWGQTDESLFIYIEVLFVWLEGWKVEGC